MWKPTVLQPLALLVLSCAPLFGQERLLLHGEQRLAIQSEKGEIEWEMPWTGAQELHALPNGNLIVVQEYGEIVEIDRETKSVVWSFDEIQLLRSSSRRIHALSCAPLANGNLLVAANHPARVLEVDRLGVVQRKRLLPEVSRESLKRWRVLPPTQDKHILVCDYRPGAVQEFGWLEGDALWESELPDSTRERTAPASTCVAAFRLEGGNTVLCMAKETSIVELDPENQVVHSINGPALAGDTAGRITSAQVLENGHVAISYRSRQNGSLALFDVDLATKTVTRRHSLRSQNADASVIAAHVLSTGPEGELLARAQRIHRETLTLDTHKDISVTLASPDYPDDRAEAVKARLSQDPTLWGSNQVDFPKMRAGGLDVAFYIVYVGQAALDEEGFARARATALMKFETIERMAERYPEHIEIARSPDDVLRIARSGKLVACIGIENGYAMGNDLAAIEEFQKRGARYMSITHNRHSQLGDSNTPADEPLHGGLSELGRRAIEEMNRVGIMVDISHAGEETTMQAIAHSKAPVIASHSSVDGVFKHGRNLSDRELLALKENGGVIQIVAFATYVKGDEERDAFVQKTRAQLGLDGSDTTNQRELRQELRERVRAFDSTREKSAVTHVADHIDYAVDLIGIDHVAISSDFDGGGGVEGWNDASQTFNVTLELVRRGYSAEDIGKLWSGNTLRVWREVERIASEL